jgi:hypothetical protein
MQSTINKPIRKANPGDATGVGSNAVSESDLAAEDPIPMDGQLPPELKDMEHHIFLLQTPSISLLPSYSTSYRMRSLN